MKKEKLKYTFAVVVRKELKDELLLTGISVGGKQMLKLTEKEVLDNLKLLSLATIQETVDPYHHSALEDWLELQTEIERVKTKAKGWAATVIELTDKYDNIKTQLALLKEQADTDKDFIKQYQEEINRLRFNEGLAAERWLEINKLKSQLTHKADAVIKDSDKLEKRLIQHSEYLDMFYQKQTPPDSITYELKGEAKRDLVNSLADYDNKIKELEFLLHSAKHDESQWYNEAIVLRKQLAKSDAVIEAGKVIANQIIGEAVYRPSTSTGDADKFFELLADYKKGKGSAAQNDQNIR